MRTRSMRTHAARSQTGELCSVYDELRAHTLTSHACEKRGCRFGRDTYIAHERRLGACHDGFPPLLSLTLIAYALSSRLPLHGQNAAMGSVQLGQQANAGATFRAYAPFRPEEAVQIDQDGWGDFLCPFGALRVWVRAEDVGDEELEGSGTDTDV